MINCEGIKAFRGSMIYDPPNPKGYKELKGEFIHKQFGDEGYWYDGWSSYDDRFCRDIQEVPNLKELVRELETRNNAIKSLIVDGENMDEIVNALRSLAEYVDGVKEMVVGK